MSRRNSLAAKAKRREERNREPKLHMEMGSVMYSNGKVKLTNRADRRALQKAGAVPIEEEG